MIILPDFGPPLSLQEPSDPKTVRIFRIPSWPPLHPTQSKSSCQFLGLRHYPYLWFWNPGLGGLTWCAWYWNLWCPRKTDFIWLWFSVHLAESVRNFSLLFLSYGISSHHSQMHVWGRSKEWVWLAHIPKIQTSVKLKVFFLDQMDLGQRKNMRISKKFF